MDKHELVVIVDAALSQGEKDAVMKEVGQTIEKNDGKVINSQVWMEKQRMSFLMKKRSEGTYYLINFEGGSANIAEMRRTLKMNDNILRFLIVSAKKRRSAR